MHPSTRILASLGLFQAFCVTLAAGEVAIQPYRTGAERRLDNPVDAWMYAWPGVAGAEVKRPENRKGDFRRFEILSNDSKNGDFSITFKVDNPARESAFGFTCGTYVDRWEVGADASLHLWLKVADAGGELAARGTGTNEGINATLNAQRSTLNAQVIGPAKMALYDKTGKCASYTLSGAFMPWQELDVPLAKFTAAEGFNFKALRSVQIEAKLPKGAQLWFDDLYFHEGDSHLGVSDKTITQLMAEVAATKPKRSEQLLQLGFAGTDDVWGPYWKGELDEANAAFERKLTELTDKETATTSTYTLYNPLHGNQLPQCYLTFSSKGRYKPGSLSPKVEKQLLEAMKLNDLLVNEIAITRASTWNVTGSENHDYNKTKALLYSQIFMHEPRYADEIYPDTGKELEFTEGSDLFQHWLKKWSYALEGIGEYKDGKEYKARDHYEAWVKYCKEYMAERARWGFFNEQNANGAYGVMASMNFTDLYTFVEDESLRKQARMFLDLMYAQWLQDQMLFIQGGAACRGTPGGGTFYQVAAFYMGHDAKLWSPVFALSDYEWSRELWEMALDRKGRGEYAYRSRKPHEERDEDPRPEGTDTTMLWRPDSRIVRYSWVTPDYVMGLRMDHPNALYTHIMGTSQGITFPTTPGATIELKAGVATRSVQERNVALVMQKHYVSVAGPTYFPNIRKALVETPVTVVIGKDVDHVEEQDGWVFAQEGEAYAAFRIVSAATNEPAGRDARGFALLPIVKDNYVLEKDKNGITTMKAMEPMQPLIVEMSRTAHHATLADFKEDVLDNSLHLKTPNQAFGYVLTYKGCGPEAKELYLNLMNHETPRIDGKYISYHPPAFDSPWLKGASGSGVVTLTGPLSGSKTVLDFNKLSPRGSKEKGTTQP